MLRHLLQKHYKYGLHNHIHIPNHNNVYCARRFKFVYAKRIEPSKRENNVNDVTFNVNDVTDNVTSSNNNINITKDAIELPPLRVVYNNGHFLVINKHHDIRLTGEFDATIEKQIRAEFPDMVVRFIHQLDFATSGILCIGMSRVAAALGSRAFARRSVHKLYTAIVEGTVKLENYPVGNPIIDQRQLHSVIANLSTPTAEESSPKSDDDTAHDSSSPIVKLNLLTDEGWDLVYRMTPNAENETLVPDNGSDSNDVNRFDWFTNIPRHLAYQDKLVVTHSIAEVENEFRMELGHPNNQGRISRTEILVIGYAQYEGRPVTKLLLRPVSGRRHQLRVHCSALGHPIVGDYSYDIRHFQESSDAFPRDLLSLSNETNNSLDSCAQLFDSSIKTAPIRRQAERMCLHALDLRMELPKYSPYATKFRPVIEASIAESLYRPLMQGYLLNVCTVDPFPIKDKILIL